MGVLYWSILSLALGACIGSFLNVVIFRWPRDMSVRKPGRSFCPACEHAIASYDNVPVLSYLWLRGRCRRCSSAISMQYPLVELATALVFLMTYDAFFVARQRLGIGDLADDWPMLIAHWALWAGLIVTAVMDLEAYMVDIQVTWLISGFGLAAHACWTPMTSTLAGTWLRPGATLAGLAAAVAVGLLAGAVLFLRGAPMADSPEDLPVESEAEQDSLTATSPRAGRTLWPWLALPIAMVVAYLAVMLFAGEQMPPPRSSLLLALGDEPRQAEMDAGTLRLGLGLVAAFAGLALVAGLPNPELDKEMAEAIEEEAATSRSKVLWELKLLTPAILGGAGVVALLVLMPVWSQQVDDWLGWAPAGHWRPLLGLATALSGWVIGGAVGWLARIFFTLVFGKEALGMGDVHILAAAGAVAGWPVAVLGFFIAALLALLGHAITWIRRPSRMLPYGPWLALGFFLASIFQDRILRALGVRWLIE